MECKHKPRDARLIVATEYGRFYTFDHPQRCRKCGKRIEIKHKKAWKMSVILIELVLIVLIFIGLLFRETLAAKVVVIGVAVVWMWIPSGCGNVMTWREIGLGNLQTDSEFAESMRKNEMQDRKNFPFNF